MSDATIAEAPKNEAASGAKRYRSAIVRRGAVGMLNGNSREAKFIKTLEQALLSQLGGNPTIVQRRQCGRAARLYLHLELMDQRAFGAGVAMSNEDGDVYRRLSSELTRLEKALGVKVDAPSGLDPHVAAFARRSRRAS